MATILRFIVDTNIFVHAANSSSSHQQAALAFLEEHRLAGTAWGTTWSVLYEFMRVSTHPRAFSQPLTAEQALSFVRGVHANPAVAILVAGHRHLEAMSETIASAGHPAGSIYHDLHIVALMREYGVKEIITADTGFYRFPGLKVTNPLR